MRGKGRFLTLLAVMLVAGLAIVSHGLGVFATPAAITDHLLLDPMIAGVYSVDPAEKIDAWIERMNGFTDDDLDPWAELDEKVGMSFRDDVLGAFGPEFAFALDMPELDTDQPSTAIFGPHVTTKLFESSIFAIRIKDPLRAVRAAGALARLAEATFGFEDDRLTITAGDGSDDDALTLHGRIRDDLIVLSGSPELVDRSYDGFASGGRLPDGADFAHVVTHVPADPELMTYFNLPKIRDWILASGAMSAADDRMERFLEEDWMGMGLIYASRRSGGGVEAAHFGPEATAEGLWVLWSGSYLVPTMLAAAMGNSGGGGPTGDSQQALAEMRSIATVVESYAIDHNVYPTTAGWEDVATLRSRVEPTYVSQLTTDDPWNRPYRFWSDGKIYRIVSGGSDRTIDRDWDGEIEAGGSSDAGADLVFGDGSFLRWYNP